MADVLTEGNAPIDDVEELWRALGLGPYVPPERESENVLDRRGIGRFADPRLTTNPNKLQGQVGDQAFDTNPPQSAQRFEPEDLSYPKDDHGIVAQEAIRAVEGLIRENFGQLDAPAETYLPREEAPAPAPQGPPTLGPAREGFGASAGKEGDPGLPRAYDNPQTLTGAPLNAPRPDPGQASMEAISQIPGPVQAFGNLPEQLVAEPLRAFGELYDLMASGARPSDPEVVKKANEVAGLFMMGSVATSAPKGALRAGASRPERTPTPYERQLDPAGFYSHAEEVAGTRLPERAPGRDMMGALEREGVRPAEIEALGLDKLLLSPIEAQTRQNLNTYTRLYQQNEARLATIQRELKPVLEHENFPNSAVAQRYEDVAGRVEGLIDQRNSLTDDLARINQHYAEIRKQAPEGSFSRQDILDHIRQNRPQLELLRREIPKYKVSTPQLDEAFNKLAGEDRNWSRLRDEFIKAGVNPTLAERAAESFRSFVMASDSMRTELGPAINSTATHYGIPAPQLRRAIQDITGHSVEDITVRGVTDLPRYRQFSIDPNNPTYHEGALSIRHPEQARIDQLQTRQRELSQQLSNTMREGRLTPQGEYHTTNREYNRVTDELDSLTTGRYTGDSHWPVSDPIGHYQASVQRLPNGELTYVPSQLQSRWAAEGSEHGFGMSGAERRDLLAQVHENRAANPTERSPVEAIFHHEENRIPAHPLVENVERWLDPMLRHVLEEARASGAKSISLPSGWTISQYNPGITAGTRELYDTIIPRRMREILREQDPEYRSIRPTETDRLHTFDDTYHGRVTRGNLRANIDTREGFEGSWQTFPLTERILGRNEPGKRLMVGGPPPLSLDDEDPLVRQTQGVPKDLIDAQEALAKLRGGGGTTVAPPAPTQPATQDDLQTAREALRRSPGDRSAISQIPPGIAVDESDPMTVLGQVQRTPIDLANALHQGASRALQPHNMRGILTGTLGGAGAIGGEIVGGPPGAGVGLYGGSALGGYLANIYEDLYKNANGPGEERVPPSELNRLFTPLRDAAIDASIGTTVGYTVPFVQQAGKNMLAWLMKLPPNSAQLLKEASDIGVDIGVANVAGARGIGGGGVNVLGRIPLIGGSVQNAARRQSRQIVAAGEDLFQRVGPSATTGEISAEALQAAQGRYRDMALNAQARYSAAQQAADQAGPVVESHHITDAAKLALVELTDRPGRVRAVVPADVRTYLTRLQELPERITVNDAQSIRFDLENLMRRVERVNPHLNQVEGVRRSVDTAMERSDHVAAKMMSGANQFFDGQVSQINQELGRASGQQFGRNVYATGERTADVVNQDAIQRIISQTRTAGDVERLRSVSGDPTVRQVARSRLDSAWAEATGMQPGQLTNTQRISFNEDRFRRSLGLDNPDSQRYQATVAMLKDTGLGIDDLEKLARTGGLVQNAPVVDPSTFLARATVLRGARGIPSALTGALTVGGIAGAGVAGGPGAGAGLALPLIARWGLGKFMEPGLLRSITTLAEADSHEAARAALIQMYRKYPSLFDNMEPPNEPQD